MRNAVLTNKASAGEGPYSQAIISRGYVYVSGQGPLDPETDAILGTTIEEQAEHTMQNIKHIVESAGSSMDDVVKVCVYLASMKDFERFNSVYQRFFSHPMPARTCIEAGLGDIMVEIDAIAEIPNYSDGAGSHE